MLDAVDEATLDLVDEIIFDCAASKRVRQVRMEKGWDGWCCSWYVMWD